MNVLTPILQLMLGLAFFLFGMNVMSSNLEKMAGGKLEHLLKKMTANPVISLILGAVITVAVQSSSATAVMLVGLVNSGIMQVSQTLYVIFGANLGTTLTSWILSLSSITSESILIQMLKPENFSPILAIVGVVMLMMGKQDKKKTIGTILVGFAVLMYGMEFMKNAVTPLADNPSFSQIMLRFDNPLLGVLVGTAFTAVIQSSAASIGVLQALSMTGSITYNMAIPIVMGANIGTCATAMISCMGTNANAKRVAVINLSIKVVGTAVLLSLYCAVRALFSLDAVYSVTGPMGIAAVHTIFNILNTLLLMPCSGLLEKLADRLVRDSAKKMPEREVFRLDERLLRAPSVALNECDSYTVKMCQLAKQTLNLSMGLMWEYNEDIAAQVLDNEDRLDEFEDSLGTYLVKLSSQALSNQDSQRISKMLHTIGDFERLGDHAVNLLKTAREMYDKNIHFSESATQELRVLSDAVSKILTITSTAYTNNDVEAAGWVEPLEQVIDDLASAIKNNHINRLQSGECTIEMGFVLSDALTNYERISDHCSNIAVAIIEVVRNSFDTHHYLNDIKNNDSEFTVIYEEFAQQFALPEG